MADVQALFIFFFLSGSSEESDRQILNGEIDLIYASPESLISNAAWREDMKKLNVHTLVIDEFHTIATWGEDQTGLKKQAFRKWFSHIGELRSLFPKASVVALSATSTVKIQKRVAKELSLGPNTVQIVMSPNKSNIKYSAFKIPSDIEIAMSWMVDGIKQLLIEFPKTLLYCTSINDVSKLYTYLIKELDSSSHSHIEMFHSETPLTKKTEIVNCLSDRNDTSNTRVIICTSALGMGIDVSNCSNVILFGLPENLVDLVQEIGRIGRSGDPSVALILFNTYHLRKLSKTMKDLCSDTCRRMTIMKHFLSETDLNELKKETGKHTCCDVCDKICSCGNCEYLSLEKLFDQSLISNSDNSQSVDSSESLDDYFDDTLDLNLC
ncbi:putative ATP-dependent DNA helicase Q1 [Saccostrea cucullata]|uniref:putative ATP-dependent DNA helicase Q1 n=1 Tax=Saccostrea cuccullata TaxID=36930 RepID=UPI002ED56808